MTIFFYLNTSQHNAVVSCWNKFMFLKNRYYISHVGDCARHPTSDPSLPTGRTDLLHVWPTPSLRGLNNLGNLRLYDT